MRTKSQTGKQEGGCTIHITLTESKDLFQDTIASPEKESELRESSYNSYIQSKYYTVNQTGNFFYQTNKYHGFSMMHFNTLVYRKI